jgi:hemerythrin-like domain-containing protein
MFHGRLAYTRRIVDAGSRRVQWRARDLDRRSPTKGEALDALKLLKDDHDKVKKLLEEGESTTERAVKTREELFAKIESELKVHEAIEEEVLYPALKEHAATKEIVLEAYEEHHVVDTVMAEIRDVPYDDETWGAKLTVMKENVEHHIEEEEDEMFKQARQVFSKEELVDLGDRMLARKEQLLAQAAQPGA